MQLATAAPGMPMRYVAHNGAGDVPPWTLRRGRRRRVSVTLGTITVELGGVDLLKAVLEALGGLDVDVVAALRPQEVELVGSLPDEVTVVEGLPIDLFMGTCDLAINHGGSGSVYTSVAHGVPQLVLPQLLHEFETGDALERFGAGLSLDTPEQQGSASLIRDAASKILDDPGHLEAARELAAENAVRPAPTELAAELVDLIAR
jgi:UDP:flavonoid glycosyltransferase YjiC (YdhE family)